MTKVSVDMIDDMTAVMMVMVDDDLGKLCCGFT